MPASVVCVEQRERQYTFFVFIMFNNTTNQNQQKDSMQVATLIHETDKMSSLEIADLTGKPHSDLLKAIRTMEPAWEKISGGKFSLAEYTDAQGKSRPCYELTKTECLYIATKFNDEARAKLVLRWEELETEKRNGGFQVPTSFKEALLLAVHQQELIEEQQKQIEQKEETIELQEAEIKKAAPKVDYYDKTLQSVNTQTTTQVAKSLGMDAHKLNRKLKEAGILYNQSGQWLLKQPYASWGMHATRTQTYTRSDGSTGTSTYTVWTEKGKRFIHALSENGFNTRKAIRQIKGETAMAV